MAIVREDDGVRCLDHGILELLLDSGTADTIQNSVEANRKQSRDAGRVSISDAQLVSEIANRSGEVGSVVKANVVHTKAEIVQQRWTKGMTPVHNRVLNRGV